MEGAPSESARSSTKRGALEARHLGGATTGEGEGKGVGEGVGEGASSRGSAAAATVREERAHAPGNAPLSA